MHNDFNDRDKIAENLDKLLGPEFLSYRPGCAGTKLTYVEGWLIISIANQIFGFDGWSSEIQSITEDYFIEKDGKISVGYSSKCKITLKNGIYKEDVGFGSADNQRVRGAAIEKAKKEAVTDSIKRALRQFGNALGNCCYDKDYIKNVTKLNTIKKSTFDSKKLLKKSDLNDNNLNNINDDNLKKNLNNINDDNLKKNLNNINDDNIKKNLNDNNINNLKKNLNNIKELKINNNILENVDIFKDKKFILNNFKKDSDEEIDLNEEVIEESFDDDILDFNHSLGHSK